MDDLTKRMIELYQSGLSLEQVGIQVGRSTGCVARRLEKAGVPRRNMSDARREYSLNEDYFEIINTEPKSNYLGFLAADGGLRSNGSPTITLNLGRKDKDYIVEFKEALKATYPVHDYERIREDGSISYGSRLCITSKKMHGDLISHGVPPRKSLILQPPIGVPKDLVRHWIRGEFDGDGCVGIYESSSGRYYKRVGITGTEEVLGFIQEELEGMGRICPDSDSPVFHFTVDIQDDVKKFYDYIYKDATVYLERKKIVLDFDLEKLDVGLLDRLDLEGEDLRLLVASGVQAEDFLL